MDRVRVKIKEVQWRCKAVKDSCLQKDIYIIISINKITKKKHLKHIQVEISYGMRVDDWWNIVRQTEKYSVLCNLCKVVLALLSPFHGPQVELDTDVASQGQHKTSTVAANSLHQKSVSVSVQFGQNCTFCVLITATARSYLRGGGERPAKCTGQNPSERSARCIERLLKWKIRFSTKNLWNLFSFSFRKASWGCRWGHLWYKCKKEDYPAFKYWGETKPNTNEQAPDNTSKNTKFSVNGCRNTMLIWQTI